MARNFESFIDGFMQYCSYVEAPEKFLRWSAISVIAGALERKVWTTNGAATWYPNLYIMLVGDAGTRKSTSSEIAVDLLRNVGGIEFLADRINEASCLAKLDLIGQSKRYYLGSEEFKHSAAYLYASEAATSFSEMYGGGNIIILLTDLFNCGPRGWHTEHAFTKHTMKHGEVKIFNPCINFLACTTPAWLTTKVMTRNDAEGGFGSRLLLVVHKGAYRKNFAWHQAEVQQVSMRMALIDDLNQIASLSGPFDVDESFKEGIEHYDKQHTGWLLERTGTSMVDGYQERKITYLIKLAQIVTISRQDKLVLSRPALDEAWELLTSLEADMLEAFQRLPQPTPSKQKLALENLNAIWGYIEEKKLNRVIKAELVTMFMGRMSVREVSIAIKGLVDAGRLSFQPRDSSLGRLVYKVIREADIEQDMAKKTTQTNQMPFTDFFSEAGQNQRT